MNSCLTTSGAVPAVAFSGLLVGALTGFVFGAAPRYGDAAMAGLCLGQFAIGALFITRVALGRGRALLSLVSTGLVAAVFLLAASVSAGPAGAAAATSWDPVFVVIVTVLYIVLVVIPVLMLMSVIGSEGVRAVRTRVRIAKGRCVACGYQLLHGPGACPECGSTARARSSTRDR